MFHKVLASLFLRPSRRAILGLKNQRVKMCAIALNCLNLFMHATKIIQAAKYMIMAVACLIERTQKLTCLFAWNRVVHKNLQLERLFLSQFFSNKAHFPYEVMKNIYHLYPQINHTLFLWPPKVAKCSFITVYHMIKYTTPIWLLEKETTTQFCDQVPYWTLCPVLGLTWQPPDFRLWYWHSRLKQPGHQCP